MKGAIFLLPLLLLSGLMLAADRSARNCPVVCNNPEPLVLRLRRIVALDWRQIDLNVIRKEWPEAPPPPDHPGPGGLEGWARLEDDIQCCCKAGQELAAPEFEAAGLEETDRNPPGLWGLNVILCRPTRTRAIAAMNELIEAVIPEHPKSKYVIGWDRPEGDGRGILAASWDTGQERFILDAGIEHRRAWRGWFQLNRRLPFEAMETWTLDGSSQVRVLRIETDQSRHPPEKDLWFTYLSECSHWDRPCWAKEVAAFWPRLKARAEREEVSVVHIWVDEGAGTSVSVRFKRQPDGSWQGPPYLRF